MCVHVYWSIDDPLLFKTFRIPESELSLSFSPLSMFFFSRMKSRRK